MCSKLQNPDFLRLFCEKNSDGTLNLRLKGRELYQRIGCRINEDNVLAVIDFLKSEPRIVSLDLCYNDLGDDGARLLADHYFNSENNLKSLNLMHCDITHNGLKYLSDSKHLYLLVCRLNGNKLGVEGARFIANLIDNCQNLEVLDIAETDQTLESIESIVILMETEKLKVIDISRVIPSSFLTKYNDVTLADDLSVMLRINTYLKELHIQKCEFDGHDVELLVEGLMCNKTLEMLNLGCNRMGDMGAELLGCWLKTRPPLRGLNVSANNIKNIGARALSYGMPYSKLRFLDISNNKIGSAGLENILDTLKKYCQMRILAIWGNTGIGQSSVCKRIERLLRAGVLNQEYFDVKLYEVDGMLHAAYYPAEHFKHNYYSVLDYGYPPELKIVRNKVPDPIALPREFSCCTILNVL
ncbi:unnamed protein product [Acanthoscelides obtectus]|uniref:Uncharacterized protein n=1 Tax=Acanthoscelides obtectus TaxID=200917 RepID=A0A9P0NSC2_ACAOB|nr:unnamed protein product [Acanthoscelides obtectus]CAK1639750.1 Leucine-rich repeat-containing protein 34 [Acanthoscelides obtectus]